jgi:hypothetical protein
MGITCRELVSDEYFFLTGWVPEATRTFKEEIPDA